MTIENDLRYLELCEESKKFWELCYAARLAGEQTYTETHDGADNDQWHWWNRFGNEYPRPVWVREIK